MTLDPSRILFVGLGDTAICWYRCAMPAMFMGADWCGLGGRPPRVLFKTGYVKHQTRMPDFGDYDLVVLQQPRGREWLRVIRELQSHGRKVLFEIDDYVHAIRKLGTHDYKRQFAKRDLAELELNMRACDGLICSTEFVARKYRAFNRRVWVCENGLDLGRYRLTRPERELVMMGWAGGTGHEQSATPWIHAVGRVMERRPLTGCVTIGLELADMLRPRFGGRAVSIPFTLVDTYPSAMTMLDIAIAPAGKGLFFRGKSDLRWLEAGALGIPIVADPFVYPKIEHGVTGFHASTPAEAEQLLELLVDDPNLRLQVGANAKEYVETHRDMRIAVEQWKAAFRDVLGAGGESKEEAA